jgi:signal peptidase II
MTPHSLSSRELGLLAAGIALVADQLAKMLVLYGLGLAAGRQVEILPFLNLVMVWNHGISYGLFPATGPAGTAALVSLSLVMIVSLSWWLWHTHRRTTALALGLVIGGAVGNNLIDRPIYGAVADFFHFYAFGYDWYVFNVADAAITFGVIALLYDALLPDTKATSGTSQVE